MDSLRAFGLDRPERETTDLSDDAIAGVVRWRDQQSAAGQNIGVGLVITRLRQGGMEGFGAEAKRRRPWWQTGKGRTDWLSIYCPEVDEQWGEVAIIGLVQRKAFDNKPELGPLEPTPELVRKFAHLAEKQDAEHIEACKEAADAQAERRIKDRNPLGTATGGMKKLDGLKAVQ